MLQRVAVRDDLSFRMVVTDGCLQFNYLIKIKLYRWFKSNKESQKEEQVKRPAFSFCLFLPAGLAPTTYVCASTLADFNLGWS